MDAGFSNALTAVLDANITTFIAGVVLYTYGTGPIKGFSVTLMIGMSTLFTGIFVSRTMMNFITRRASARLAFEVDMHLIKPGTQFDFVGQRRRPLSLSIIMVIASITLFFVKGPNWGIDFTGGTEVHLRVLLGNGHLRGALRAHATSSGGAVQQIGADEEGEYVIRIQDPEFGAAETRASVESALTTQFGDGWISETDYTAEVGARLTVRYTGAPVTLDDVQAAVDDIPGTKAAPEMSSPQPGRRRHWRARVAPQPHADIRVHPSPN